MTEFGPLLTAMVTPFDDLNNIDYEQARKLAVALLNSGSDGVVVSGTTGEAPTLTMEEKLRLFAEVKSAVGDRGIVVAGTGSYSTKASVELTVEAQRAGVDAVLLVVPYYNKPTQEGLFQHFKAIAGSTSLPCILYNIPSRSVINLSVDTTAKLGHIDNIIGTKEASSNFEQIARIIETASDDFLVYSGNDSDTLPILALGGYGVVSVASHLVGNQIKEMMQCFRRGELQEAARIHRRLLPLFDVLFIVSNPAPIKHALGLVGFPAGKPRLPLVEPDLQSKALIESTLGNYEVDLLGGLDPVSSAG